MKAEEGFQDQEEEHCDEEGPPYRARKAAVAGGILFFKKAESGIGKGGIKVDAGASHHAELVANGTPQVVVFLLDANDQPILALGYRAHAILIVDGGTQRFALQPGEGNRLVGTAPVPVPTGTKGAVQITGPDGATAQARF